MIPPWVCRFVFANQTLTAQGGFFKSQLGITFFPNLNASYGTAEAYTSDVRGVAETDRGVVDRCATQYNVPHKGNLYNQALERAQNWFSSQMGCFQNELQRRFHVSSMPVNLNAIFRQDATYLCLVREATVTQNHNTWIAFGGLGLGCGGGALAGVIIHFATDVYSKHLGDAVFSCLFVGALVGTVMGLRYYGHHHPAILDEAIDNR